MSECPKVRFATRAKADARLDEIDREPRRARQVKLPVRAYFCPRCWGWHLTSRASRQAVKARA